MRIDFLVREWRIARKRRSWKKQEWHSCEMWSPISSPLTRMTPRFRTCVADTRVGDTDDRRSQFRFASCCLVPNQRNWVLSGLSRSLFDAIQRRTASMQWNGGPVAITFPHPKPDSCRRAPYRPHRGERPGRRMTRSQRHPQCKGHIGEVQEQSSVERLNGQAPRSM